MATVVMLTDEELKSHVCMWRMADKLKTSRSNLAAAYDLFHPDRPFYYDEYYQPYFPVSEEAHFLNYLQKTNHVIGIDYTDYHSDYGPLVIDDISEPETKPSDFDSDSEVKEEAPDIPEEDKVAITSTITTTDLKQTQAQARMDRIREAILTYPNSEPRMKKTKYPFVKNLRTHSQMYDITVRDRNRAGKRIKLEMMLRIALIQELDKENLA